jgi:translocation and assembly module TamB
MSRWRKIIGWAAVAIGALVLIVVVAAIVLLKSPAFQQYLVAKIEQKADASLGARVEIQNLDFQLKNLTAVIYGLTVHGNEPADAKPLLQVEKITAGVKIISVLGGKVNLSELLIEKPAVNLTVNKAGETNLPHPPPSQGGSSINIFNLAVGHVLLTNGQVVLRDRKIPVDANLNDLRTEIRFSRPEQKYSGTLSYRDGQIQYENLRPLGHDLNAAFDATPDELNLKPLLLRVGGSRFRLTATVRDYSSAPSANGSYEAVLATQDFAGLSSSASASGLVDLKGTVAYKDVPGRTLLRNLNLAGEIGSNGLRLSSPQAVIAVQRVTGHYQLANGNFRADGFAMDLLNGRVTANGVVEDVTSTRNSRFQVKVAGISLQAVKASLRNYSTQSMPVTGSLNASADARWRGSLSQLEATAALVMHGSLVGAVNNQRQRFPLNADLHVRYDAPRSLFTVASSSIELPATSIHAQGEVGNHSKLTVQASSSDLHQLIQLAAALPASAGASSASKQEQLATVHGTATMNAVITGTLKKPEIAAQLSASNLQVKQSQWDSLKVALAANPSQIAVQSASLVSATEGQLQFTARIGLHNWSYSETSPIAATAQIQKLQIPGLEELANVDYPIEGQLFADVQVQGSALDPQGHGQIQIHGAKVSDQPLKTVAAQFRAAQGTIQSHLTIGALAADVSYTPKTESYAVNAQASNLDLSKSQTVQAKNLPVKGIVTFTAKGEGTIANPQLNASVEVSQLQLQNTSFSRLDTTLAIAQHVARLAVNSGVSGASVHGQATVHLSPGYYTEASLDTSRFALDPFLEMYVPSLPTDLHGETEVHVSVRGPATDKRKLEAHLTVPVLSTSYQSLQVAATRPIHVDYADSVLTLQPASIKGTNTSLQLQGRIPIDRPGEMAVSANGSIDMKLAQMFSPNIRSRGTIAVDVRARGNFKDPNVNGQIRLQKVSLSTEQMPLGIQNFDAVMQITKDHVQVTNGSGQLGAGPFTLGGSVTYRPQLQINLAFSAKSVRIRYPEGMRTILDADLTVSGNRQASVLQGRVLIDSLSFTSDFDLSSFMTQFTGTSAPPTGESMADNLKLEVAIQSTNQLNAGTAQLGIEGTANLRLIGTAANPVVIGRADLTSGDIFFDKNQYHLERGVITFANPNQTEPVLNMLITTTINQYNLSITIRGPVQKLQTSYVSDPPLSPIDIINLIARGETTSSGAPTSFGANEVLAAGLGQVSSEVTKLTGIAGLQIDPLIGGANADPSARIGIQKRVTKNFTFTFSTDVTQPQSEIVQGEYQLTKRWSVSVERNESGGFAVDGRFHTNF